MKAIKALILSLALLVAPLGGVTADVNYNPTVVINMACGGVNILQSGTTVIGLTATHCVDLPSGPRVIVYTTRGAFISIGEIVAKVGDITVFEYQLYSDRPAALATPEYNTPKQGDILFAPAIDKSDGTHLMTVYFFTNKRSFWMDQWFWQVQGPVVKGFSGTPVFTRDGKVVGVISIGFEVANEALQAWAGYSDIKLVQEILNGLASPESK